MNDFFENEFIDDVDDMDDDCDDCDDDSVFDDKEPVDTESDEFTAKDALILGGAMGWAYEEGFLDGSHQRRQRKAEKSEGRSRKKRKKDGFRKDNVKVDGDFF